MPGSAVGRGRRLIFARNQEAEARITLSLYDEAAIRLFEVLRNGIPQLRVYLQIPDAEEAAAVALPDDGLVFSGHWTPMSGASAVGEQSHVNLVFKDAFSILRHRFLEGTTEFSSLSNWDAGMIAKYLIDDLPFYPSGESGTTIATDDAWIEPSQVRERTYKYKNIAEAITELTEVIGGFDWFPVYLDPRRRAKGDTMEFHVAAERGSDRSGARFEYGDSTLFNCKSYGFTAALPVNYAIAIGAEATAGTGYDDDSRNRFRTYMTFASMSDVTKQATLIEKAADALRPNIGLVTQFTGDPAKCPLPWRDFWIGDTIRWNVDDGAMQEQSSPRVQTIEVGLDDSDNIEDLVVGVDPEATGSYLAPANTTRRYVQQQRELTRRLNAIERRVGL